MGVLIPNLRLLTFSKSKLQNILEIKDNLQKTCHLDRNTNNPKLVLLVI